MNSSFSSDLGRLAALAALGLLATACGGPVLDSLEPDSGPPHTLVGINGEGKTGSGVYWDAGTAGETDLNRALLGGGPISVPDGATVGAHGVQMRNRDGESATRTFTVTAPATPFPKPRLEYVTTCCWRAGSAPGRYRFLLLTQSANADVHAQIKIEGTVRETVFVNALRYDGGGLDAATLGYPVLHYAMHATPLEGAPGQFFRVAVINDGGEATESRNYRVPSPDQRDDDGDGLLNDWEINGYDADGDGRVDVDLPALGADPNHKDVFVEVDFMEGKIPPVDPWTPLEQAFADAPILNLSGGPGIHLHIDRGQGTRIGADGSAVAIPVGERGGGTILPFYDYIGFIEDLTPCAAPGETAVTITALKLTASTAARRDIFHYAVFAENDAYNCGASGVSERWGNDFMVMLPDSSLTSTLRVAGTVMHELGHNLNLIHGGQNYDSSTKEPNHQSIMSYRYAMDGIDIDCDARGDRIIDYSRGRLALINETAIDENKGICNNVAIDWNRNGVLENPVAFNIEPSDRVIDDDFNDWGELLFNFRNTGSNWSED